jgi:hypothetical protein
LHETRCTQLDTCASRAVPNVVYTLVTAVRVALQQNSNSSVAISLLSTHRHYTRPVVHTQALHKTCFFFFCILITKMKDSASLAQFYKADHNYNAVVPYKCHYSHLQSQRINRQGRPCVFSVSQRRAQLHLKTVHAGFVVDNVTLRQLYLRRR